MSGHSSCLKEKHLRTVNAMFTWAQGQGDVWGLGHTSAVGTLK